MRWNDIFKKTLESQHMAYQLHYWPGIQGAAKWCGWLPKYLAWFENVLLRNPKGSAHLVGRQLSYTDLSLFQLVDELLYAFSKNMSRALKKSTTRRRSARRRGAAKAHRALSAE